MRFREIRQRVIAALSDGIFRFEYRETSESKNLLETGEVTPGEVADLLARCRGDQHCVSAHHADPSIPVHVFLPVRWDGPWYIKVYLDPVEPEPDEHDVAIFISVHRSEFPYRGRR